MGLEIPTVLYFQKGDCSVCEALEQIFHQLTPELSGGVLKSAKGIFFLHLWAVVCVFLQELICDLKLLANF